MDPAGIPQVLTDDKASTTKQNKKKNSIIENVIVDNQNFGRSTPRPSRARKRIRARARHMCGATAALSWLESWDAIVQIVLYDDTCKFLRLSIHHCSTNAGQCLFFV